jgi:hypothetical protein
VHSILQAKQRKSEERKAKQSKAKQSKAKQSKAKQSKATTNKAHKHTRQLTWRPPEIFRPKTALPPPAARFPS